MKNKFATLLLLSFVFTLLYACEYNNLEEIHPDLYHIICDDTTSRTITYTSDIKQIMETSCGALDVNCHKTGNTAQINLDNYAETTDAAVNGDLLGSILHQPGYKPMPKDAGKLDECSTLDIMAWINRGEPQ